MKTNQDNHIESSSKLDALGRVVPKGFGGAIPGSGRKTKAEEFGLARLLDECWTTEQRKEVITKLHEYAISGEKSAVSAATLLLAYAYGKPKEHVRVDVVDFKKLAAETLAELQDEYKLPLEQARAIVTQQFGDVLEENTVA